MASSPFSHPSIHAHSPLVDSYTYHSIDAELALALSTADDQKGKGRQSARDGADATAAEGEEEAVAPLVQGKWMLGVDEAGRGPVLGPQVYGIAFCPIEYEEELKSLGFADSKTLTAERRDALLEVMNEHAEKVKWSVTVMSPHDLSRGMLRKNPYNLNAQSHDTTINLIREVLQRGYEITQCYVDTVGIASDYQKKLEQLFPPISFVVTSKADAIYPIVSAASIAAKVTRDRVLESWTFLERGLDGGVGGEGEREGDGQGEELGRLRAFGSGYPGDPKTIAWLENNVDPIFGYPNIARFSWQTVKTILVKRGAAKVKWNDEPATIQKYFSGEPVGPPQVALWRDFALSSVASF